VAAEGGCCAERRSWRLESRLRGAASAMASCAVMSMLCSVCAHVVACSCVLLSSLGGRESWVAAEAPSVCCCGCFTFNTDAFDHLSQV
jgi:predicted transporter